MCIKDKALVAEAPGPRRHDITWDYLIIATGAKVRQLPHRLSTIPQPSEMQEVMVRDTLLQPGTHPALRQGGN